MNTHSARNDTRVREDLCRNHRNYTSYPNTKSQLVQSSPAQYPSMSSITMPQ